MSKQNKKYFPSRFPQIQTAEELRMYLDDTASRLHHSPYVYHYTTYSNVIKMIKSRNWHLSNASTMNDKLEYKNGDPHRWHNLFFSCFMCEDKESIGMWSMYAQPWEKGVKISIPKEVFRRWIKNTSEITEVLNGNNQSAERTIIINENNASLKISAVAYCNTDSLQENKEKEKIQWSNTTNTNIKEAVRIPELTGYVKDMAWSYEKEIRIKAEFENIYNIKRVAIPLTDEVLNNMTITLGPLFKNDFLLELKKSLPNKTKIKKSIFSDRLNIKTICQQCEYKQRSE